MFESFESVCKRSSAAWRSAQLWWRHDDKVWSEAARLHSVSGINMKKKNKKPLDVLTVKEFPGSGSGTNNRLLGFSLKKQNIVLLKC